MNKLNIVAGGTVKFIGESIYIDKSKLIAGKKYGRGEAARITFDNEIYKK